MLDHQDRFAVSFEVYPPRSPELVGSLHTAIDHLSRANPEFISVTFGAGGSSARDSLGVLEYIRNNTQASPLAHLTCVGNTHAEAQALIQSFLDAGITEFLALRGDLPSGDVAPRGDLPHAVDLVAVLKNYEHPERSVERVAVAAFPNGHPESPSRGADIGFLRAKQDAGATLAITQLFFLVEEYLDFVAAAHNAGVTIPILPGIMPITSLSRLERVLELTGEKAPQALVTALSDCQNTEDQRAVGIEWAASLTTKLKDSGSPGIHLYAFNQHETVLSVLEQAGVR